MCVAISMMGPSHYEDRTYLIAINKKEKEEEEEERKRKWKRNERFFSKKF